MDLISRRYVYVVVFVCAFLIEKVLLCELTPESERTECGDSVSSADACPATCCYDDSTTPKCYFREKDYGPIRHSNGLCINVKSDLSTLVWSRDCTSRNAFFLVSYDHPPFHLASGKCVLPTTAVNDPKNANLVIRRNKQNCNSNTVTYRSTTNGNLKYFYQKGPYEICIGSKSILEPRENDRVSIQSSVCNRNNSCNFNYVYERMFSENENASFHCESCSTIEIIQANYGVKMKDRYPLAISSSDANCVTTTATKVVKDKCDGRDSCSFVVNKNHFLQTSCQKSTILLVRYTCKWKIPAAPSELNVTVEGRNVLLIVWSNDNNNGKRIRFKIFWNIVGETFVQSVTQDEQERTASRRLTGLQEATAYEISVARYNDDKRTVGRKRHKIAITRSAALQNTGKKSATSFEIQLGKLQSDDKYIQIVVDKTNRKPTKHPGNDLQPYDRNTVNSKPYIAAELGKTFVNQNSLFTVGDDKSYSKATRTRRDISFKNARLEPDTGYSVFQRTFRNADLYYDSDWMDVVTTDKSPTTIKSQTKNSIATETTTRRTTTRRTTTKPVGGNGGGNGGPLDEKQDGGSSEGSGTVIIGAGAGGGFLLIILVIFIIIYVRRRRGGNGSGNDRLYDKPVEFKKTKKKKSLDVEDENYPPSSDMGEENKNTITAPSGDVYAKPVKKKHRTESEGGENKQNGLQTDTYANVQGITPDDNSNGVKITRFLFYVEEMKKNDNFGFKKEFEDLPVGQVHPWDVGRKAGNIHKNKYSNNAAYDHSRVVLSGEEDYVNANFIKGVQSELYIAAQGPTDQTVNDFWRMIWEQDCTCIIALTNVVELGKVKCTQYWPDKEITFGDIHVKTVKTGLFADYVIRYLDLKKDGKGKTIVQYHFISWPDHGVPKYPTKLLAFRHRFRALHTVSTRPIVVHCSAGVGRTGTFIALDITLLRVNTLQENTINIHDAVKELRNERVNMVQTLEQYVFLHDAVLETVLCGFTETMAENLKTEIERLQQKELNKSISEFEVEFKKLASVTYPLAPDECKSALLQKNKSKNRVSNIYPTENFRVFICGTKEEEDPYINATYVHGYTHARAYIATQAPLLDTIDDFWKMVFEKKTVVVVMLNDTSEGKMTYPQYWPDEFNQEQQYGDLFVKMVSAETRGPIISRKFVITNKSTKAAVAEHVVRHVQFTDWPEHGVPGNHSDVMDLLDSVEEAQQRSENGTVIVHCSDGAQRTGTYLTLAIQRERVRTEHVIDIFRCIKMMREQRPQFVGNLEQYKFCYYAMVTFIESFMTYDNIPKVQKK